jgi:glycosyl transferase family 1
MKYLFGCPVARFTTDCLHHARARGDCLTVGPQADLTLDPDATWADVRAKLPESFQPEFIAHWLAYNRPPAWVWEAELPVIGLAPDWQCLWHEFHDTLLPRCDAVLTDLPGVEVMHKAGFAHARQANLFGLERAYLEEPFEEGERDLDVVFVGSVQQAVQRERLRWLAGLSRMGLRVVIATGIFGAEYRALLRRAKIVFDRSVRGECNMRALEAAACGALLLLEGSNREILRYFEPGKEYIPYGQSDLEAIIRYFLDNEDKRRAVTEAARLRVQGYSFDALWQQSVAGLEADWEAIKERAAKRRGTAFPAARPLSPLLRQVLRVEDALRAGRDAEAANLAR